MRRLLLALIVLWPSLAGGLTSETPKTITVTPNVTGLGVGTYQGTVTIQNSGVTGDTKQIPVTLNLTCTDCGGGAGIENLCSQMASGQIPGVTPISCETQAIPLGAVYNSSNLIWDPPNYEGQYEACKNCVFDTNKNGGYHGGMNLQSTSPVGATITGVSAATAGLPAAAGTATLLQVGTGTQNRYDLTPATVISGGTYCDRRYFKFTPETMCTHVPATPEQSLENAAHTGWTGLPGICRLPGNNVWAGDCDADSDCSPGYICRPKCWGIHRTNYDNSYDNECPRNYIHRMGTLPASSVRGAWGWLSDQGTNNALPFNDPTIRDNCYINQPFLAGEFGDMAYSRTVSGDTITLAECKANWCREEFCIDHNSRAAPNANKIHFRHRITVVGTGRQWTRESYNPYQADPKELSPNALASMTVGASNDQDFGVGMIRHQGGGGVGEYDWGIMQAKKTPADENWWIGPASEVESSPQSYGAEKRYTTLRNSGSWQYLCSDPLSSETHGNAFTGGSPPSGDNSWYGYMDPDDSPDASECYPLNQTSGQLPDGKGILQAADTARSAVRPISEEVAYLPSVDQTKVRYVWGRIQPQMTGSVVHAMDVESTFYPDHTYCMRTYRRWPKPGNDSMSQSCNNFQWKVLTAMLGNQQQSCKPAYLDGGGNRFTDDYCRTHFVNNDFQIDDGGGTTIKWGSCTNHWCGFENCADYFADGSVKARHYTWVVGTAENSFWESQKGSCTYDNQPCTTGGQCATGRCVAGFCTVGKNDCDVQGDCAAGQTCQIVKLNSWRYPAGTHATGGVMLWRQCSDAATNGVDDRVSHVMQAGKVGVDPTFRIGPACELEGGC